MIIIVIGTLLSLYLPYSNVFNIVREKKVMMTPPQLQLPTIRVSDIEILADWDFENVKALGDSIPGFRSSSSQFYMSFCLERRLRALYPFDSVKMISLLTSTSFPNNPSL